MMNRWERRKVLVTVRTYPIPAAKGVEVSCTAGITETGDWIRLFPVPYRFLAIDKRFQKYPWIDVNTKKANDPRPESYNLDVDSIRTVGEPIPPDGGWKLRWQHVAPRVAHCMCCLKAELKASDRPTLGFFRPRSIDQLVIERDKPDWTPQELAKLRQATIWEHTPTRELEKIPFKFSYRYRCDHDSCNGHKMMCTDWELGESYRRWRDKYGEGWRQKFCQRYEHDMIKLNETYLYVGTVREHPQEWIIVGLWYPRRRSFAPQTALL